MVKYFGLLIVLTTLLMVGCAGQETATEEEATQGMDDYDSMAEPVDTGPGAAE